MPDPTPIQEVVAWLRDSHTTYATVPTMPITRVWADAIEALVAEVERLRGLCLPEFEGEIAVKLMRIFAPDDSLEWVCHWWPIEGDVMSQRYGEGATIREAILAAMKERPA